MTLQKYVIEQIYAEVKGSDIHNRGVFATKDIPKGTPVIEYTGMILSKEEGELAEEIAMQRFQENPEVNAATYMFELTETTYLDGDIPNNDAKYINHSCDPNCEVEIGEKSVWIISIKDIKKGEELSFNYGFDINDKKPYEFKLHICRCGSPKCVGYILDEDEWPKMRELLDREKQQ